MKIEEIFEQYVLNDGRTLSFNVDFLKRNCFITLKVRCVVDKKKLTECEIELTFEQVESIDISEDFRTGGGYSDITLAKLANGSFYLSTDPYGNTGSPDDRDNNVIVAASFSLISENGQKFEIS